MEKENVIREKESKTDIAYRVMLKKKKERNFYDLWEDVKAELAKVAAPEELENVEEDISFFYTNLTLDGRFVCVGENKWNLKNLSTRLLFAPPVKRNTFFTKLKDLPLVRLKRNQMLMVNNFTIRGKPLTATP